MKLLLLLFFFSASVAAEPRPAVGGVSSFRIANYGAPSAVINDRARIADVVGELNLLRKKDWQRGELKISFYATLVLLRGDKRVGEYRIGLDGIVERPVEKGQTSYSLVIAPDDLPAIGKLLAEIKPMDHKDCK